MNIILTNTDEYRLPYAGEQTIDTDEPVTGIQERFVGLVMIPGKYIHSILSADVVDEIPVCLNEKMVSINEQAVY